MNFINQRRLRDYPRLILGTMVFVLLINILLGKGWMGAVKQVIGGDFMAFYTGGLLYSQDINSLYDFQKQSQLQQDLIAPTPLAGFMPFFYPPYVAQTLSLVAKLPLTFAFLLWTLLSITCVVVATFWISKNLVPGWLREAGLTTAQLFVVTCSFFAFIEGLHVGQNHGITLLLLTGMVVCSIKEKWFMAGLLAGLTIYKPQFAIGFLIVWLMWGKAKALAGYAITSMIWVSWFILTNGIELIQEYLSIIPFLLKLPYMEGFGGYLEVTPYGFLISILPLSAWRETVLLTQILTFLLSLCLAWIAFKTRRQIQAYIKQVLILAVLFPLLIAPHMLLHDLIILIPALILWADLAPSRSLLYTCMAIYFGAFLIPSISYITGIALLALIPIMLFTGQIRLIAREWITSNAKAHLKN